MSKTLESRDALFCLCCCTAFGGGNRPGARREARLLRRVEAICHGYEQRAADSKHDFVILCGVMNGNVKEYFIIPTFVVDTTLKESNRIYHLGKKKDGSKRKVTNHRALFLQESKDHYWCGWRRKWKKYLNNWSILEKNV